MYGCTKIGNFQRTCIFPGEYLHTSLTIQCTVTDYRHHLSWKQYNIRVINFGGQKAPTILITGLLLHMHGTYVASFVFPVPGSEIVGSAELGKREHEKKKGGNQPAPPTFRVLFTFTSSPLSESLEQACFVWTSTKNESSAENTIWSRVFGPSITYNLIECFWK